MFKPNYLKLRSEDLHLLIPHLLFCPTPALLPMLSRFWLTRSPNAFIFSIMASISDMSFSICGVNLPCFFAWSLKPLIMLSEP